MSEKKRDGERERDDRNDREEEEAAEEKGKATFGGAVAAAETALSFTAF